MVMNGQKQAVTMKKLSINRFEIIKTTNVFDIFPGDFIDRNDMKTMVENHDIVVNMVGGRK